MQVICISDGTHGGGRELAERLAEKLGCGWLSREELIEAAVGDGIQVGKLEMAMIKPLAFSEYLAIQKEHFRAFSTAYLCDRVADGRLVYHGRMGHLLLPGVSHVLRVRVVTDQERRIRTVMKSMGIERSKARKYIEQVDEDHRHWARSMYGISVDEPSNYDIVVNLEQLSVENAASAIVGISQLPDFQMTPASRRAMQDLNLGAKSRLALASDRRTFKASFKVRADAGVVTVTYLPQDSKLAPYIPDILRDVQGVSEVRSTMAMTNILWIQQQYQPQSDTYNKVVEISTKWNAAVELMRLVPEPLSGQEAPPIESLVETADYGPQHYNGGIEDDGPELSADDGGVKSTLDQLASISRSGGGRTVYGDPQQIVDSLDRSVPYTLVVIGDVFLSKGHSARVRATRDLRTFLSDRIKAPVVTADELGSQYLFGKRDIISTTVYSALTFAIYYLVFSNQESILAFLAQSGWYEEVAKNSFLARFDWMPKLVVCLAVVLLVPIVAYSYGRVTSALLKLIKME